MSFQENRSNLMESTKILKGTYSNFTDKILDLHIMIPCNFHHQFHLHYCFAFRFSILFKQLGFQPGDCLYAMTGDSNYIYAASLAVWRLGGFVALGWSDKIDLIAAQLNETKPSIILVDSTHGEVVLEAIRHSTHATFNSRVLSIGYLNDHCHNVLNLIRNIDVNFVPEITQPVDPLLVHWSKGRN